MTEREKLLTGEYYDSRDPELLEMYHQARALLREWTNLSSREIQRKHQILQQLFLKIGEGVWIEYPFYCDYGRHISIGENTFINTNAVLLDCNHITIGKNGLIGPNVQIYTATHPLKAAERIISSDQQSLTSYKTRALPVMIGDNVWIGGNTLILPGVKIGNNVTVAANSLVTKDLPDNVLAMGSPAKILRQL